MAPSRRCYYRHLDLESKSEIYPIRKPVLLPIIACLYFFLIGRAFIPHLGIQNDEALFAGGIFHPLGSVYSLNWGSKEIPLMLMSYMGTLKSWIYAPIFGIWHPTASSTRVPVLFAGCLTIWLFYLLLRRVAGARAALAGCALLATDTIFFLTTCFDWGPVALQHLLLVGGMLAVLRHYQEQQHEPYLALGFFLFGLGMWDKALFIWLLSGLGVATCTIFPREVLKILTLRRAAVAALAFSLGAFPLIKYNVAKDLGTFRTNATYSATEMPQKIHQLRSTLDGSALFGWLVREDVEAQTPRRPQTRLQQASFWLSDRTGHLRKNLMLPVFFFAIALFPLLWLVGRQKPGTRTAMKTMLFALIVMLVTWLQMALTKGAGGAAHHTILLWPFPQMFMAVGFAEASRYIGRLGLPLLALLLIIACCSNFLVTNEYYHKVMRNGGGRNWTDAIYPLSGYLRQFSGGPVLPIDWGILDSLRLLDRGQLNLFMATDPITKPSLDQADEKIVLKWLMQPGAVFVDHTPGNVFFPGGDAHLEQTAAEFGFRREMLNVICDRNGRPMFEVFRYVR